MRESNPITNSERRRLIAIAKAEKALPWDETDETLALKGLVTRYHDVMDAPLASISGAGWNALKAISRRA